MTTEVYMELPSCHGCGGKGWVDSMYKGAQVCPVCRGTGITPTDDTTRGA